MEKKEIIELVFAHFKQHSVGCDFKRSDEVSVVFEKDYHDRDGQTRDIYNVGYWTEMYDDGEVFIEPDRHYATVDATTLKVLYVQSPTKVREFPQE
ncbi:MAG: hypothetical protein ACKVOR_09790 [Flavobacteriales bacterium]